jgi:histidinol-phosphate aminotransferase
VNPLVANLLREDLRGRTPYGAPQLDVPVRLNTNENSYAVPDDVVTAIAASVTETARHLNRYPDREFTDLREALAAYLRSQTGVGITPEQVWAGNGSNEVLLHLVQAFGGVGRTALGFTPAYSMHPIITRTTGTTWVDGLRGTPTGVFDLDAALAVRQVRATKPHIVFLCSPNNPTGTALSLDVVRAVVEAAPESLVVVDEAYAEFARPGTPSAMTLLEGRPLLVVTRTMSKAFALAGARVGYLAAEPDLVDALRLVRMPYHLSDPTQAVALAAIRHDASLLATVEAIKGQRDRIVAELEVLGYPPVPSDANFVLYGGLADAHATWQALLDRGVLVRDVGIPHHLRVTAGTPEETSTFLRAMADLPDSHRQRARDIDPHTLEARA